ncbi:FlgO family outer membrane protein [Glaciecola siphonariae]|uniref:FlgO family outer membrane protein n=1 Tax=Glaciecola siphonariae TaxID=521012 RepID=A0ABV9LTY2_9ALTE
MDTHLRLKAAIIMRNSMTSAAAFVLCMLSMLVLLGLSGCANNSAQVQKPARASQAWPAALGNAELYTHQLAQELFANLTADRQYRYAVVGFVPVATMQQDLSQQGPLMLLGHQLEQGLTTEVVRRGFIAQDYKATNTIIMGSDSERALSRNVEHLRAIQAIDYYITGTITEQQNGAMVNARIINVRNKDVIAAATKFFPAELFWQQEQVTMRNGMLYRSSHPTQPYLPSGD